MKNVKASNIATMNEQNHAIKVRRSQSPYLDQQDALNVAPEFFLLAGLLSVHSAPVSEGTKACKEAKA